MGGTGDDDTVNNHFGGKALHYGEQLVSDIFWLSPLPAIGALVSGHGSKVTSGASDLGQKTDAVIEQVIPIPEIKHDIDVAFWLVAGGAAFVLYEMYEHKQEIYKIASSAASTAVKFAI